MSDENPLADIPSEWFSLEVLPGVDCSKPGIYEWRIEGRGSYIGKYKRIRRPWKEYGRNVARLQEGMPYRKGNPDGFRRIHHELFAAKKAGVMITLFILENVEGDEQNRREQELIGLKGNLNGPNLCTKREQT